MKQGRKWRDEFFAVYVVRNQKPWGRLGLAVSRRNAPKAVTRNWIKRQIRESFRLHRQMLAGLDLVIVAHGRARHAQGSQLRTSLEQHWQRATQECKSF